MYIYSCEYWEIISRINDGIGLYEGEKVKEDEEADNEMGRTETW